MVCIHRLAQNLAILLLLHISARCVSHWHFWIQELTPKSAGKTHGGFSSIKLDRHYLRLFLYCTITKQRVSKASKEVSELGAARLALSKRLRLCKGPLAAFG